MACSPTETLSEGWLELYELRCCDGLSDRGAMPRRFPWGLLARMGRGLLSRA
ncbi:MAG: hypothetical protein H0V75_08325 [Rubrobacter sp.]|nr:hypothetical protein [Rubrobacter sp.]